MKTAIAYYRYSSHKQGEQSIEGQAEAAHKWADEHDYTIVKEYADRAVSGRTDNREEFQLMLKEAQKIRPDTLILWKVDRMGRNREEVAINKTKLKKCGCSVNYVAETIPDSPEGIILESVLEGFAEYYSVQLSENVKRGMRVSASKGQRIGGYRPYGYDVINKKYVINEGEAKIVREMFQRYADGQTAKEIRNWLSESGLRNVTGKEFSYSAIRNILSGRKYIGEYKVKDLVIPDGFPRIIDDETFEKVQSMLSSHTNKSEEFILTGKLFCGHCGSAMRGISGTSHLKRKYYYYACRGKCGKKNVPRDIIEKAVLNAVLSVLNDEELIEDLADRTVKYYNEKFKDTSYLDSLEARLKDVNAALNNIQKAIEIGVFTPQTKDRIADLTENKESLEISIAKEKSKRNLDVTKDNVITFFHRLRDSNVKSARIHKIMIRTFVNAIYLYDDSFKIVFNTKESSKRFEFTQERSTIQHKNEPFSVEFMGDVFAITFPFRK